MGDTDVGTWPPGWHVAWVGETGSTNADLLAAGTGGAPDRSVLAADHQNDGRGRLDRRWDAPPGTNLLVSLLLRSGATDPHAAVRRVALAALVAAERTTGARAGLKWPNDVMVDDRKLAGVLAQGGRSATGPFVVVGLGMNIAWAPEGAAMLGAGVDRRRVLREVLTAVDDLDDQAVLDREYRHRLVTIGRRVRVEAPGDRIVEGDALDVADDGALTVVDGDGVAHRIDAGDVIHLRPA